jgi:hypothetical protein
MSPVVVVRRAVVVVAGTVVLVLGVGEAATSRFDE